MNFLGSSPYFPIFAVVASIVLMALAVVLLVVWLLLPFALFGIKSRLDKLNENLKGIRRVIEEQGRHGSEPDIRLG